MTIGQLKELLQRYLTGKATDEDLRIIDGWFRRTEGKEYQLTDDRRKEVAARLLPRLQAIIYPEQQQPAGKISPMFISRRIRRIAAVFLVLSGAAAAGYYYRYPLLDRIDPITQQTVTAGLYEIRSVVLPDSTRAVLNSGSSITYPVRYRGGLRKVAMQGEVFFDVRKDPSAPFTVHSPQMDIKVIGTSFVLSDRQQAANTVVSVLSGKIQAAHEREDLGPVTAGRELSYEHNSGRAFLQNIHGPQAIAWIHKTFSFNETPLQSVFAAMENKFGVHFRIRNRNPGAVKLFTGYFSEGDTMKDMLLALSLSTGITYKYIDHYTIDIHYP